MKRVYESPKAYAEMFTPNEYVAACYSLYCQIPGDVNKSWVSKVPGHDAYVVKSGFTMNWGNLTFIADKGQWHGSCASGSSYDAETKTFYENSKPTTTTVENVQIGKEASDGKQYAIWSSGQVGDPGTYCHYGYAVPTNDPKHPNHS